MTALVLEALSVWQPGAADPVLQGIDLTLARGEILALVGTSGVGKTTLARAICGLLPPGTRQQGRIELAAGLPAVAPVFQAPRAGLSELRRIGDQIADALALAGRGRHEVAGLLTQLGLDPAVAQLRAGALSGGMAQRVAIARAVATGAPLIVADEPTAALDGPAAQRVLEVLGHARTAGRAVLLITHDPNQVEQLADRIAVMAGGRILECGLTSTVMAQPVRPATRALFAALPARARTLADLPKPVGVLPEGTRRPVAQPLLELTGLGFEHGGGPGLDDISLQVASGEVLALLGASGSGKTTLARIIARLLPLHRGQLRLCGDEIGAIAPARFARDRRRARIQLVFQESGASFTPWQSVGQMIAAAQRRLGLPVARIIDSCGPAGLDPTLLARLPGQMSQGQLARAALVRALAAGPDLLVLDEPAAALDPVTQAGILHCLAGLRSAGCGIILVTHDLHVARLLADRIAVLDNGRLVETGPARDLLAAPAHPATRALVAAMPVHRPLAPTPTSG